MTSELRQLLHRAAEHAADYRETVAADPLSAGGLIASAKSRFGSCVEVEKLQNLV